MAELTKRQQQVFDFIKLYISDKGMPPTRVDIAAALGFRSPNAAEDHLKALARKGAIELVSGASRGIRILEDEEYEHEEEGLPLVGRVAAGHAIFSEEHIEDRFPVAAGMFQPGADYLLRVRGMSMRDAGILEGDLLAVHQTRDVRNGQVVVARIDGEVTVKRYQREGNKVFLLPENPDYPVIEVDLTQDKGFEIEGLGVGIIRNQSAL